jgi:hypothetical protein
MTALIPNSTFSVMNAQFSLYQIMESSGKGSQMIITPFDAPSLGGALHRTIQLVKEKGFFQVEEVIQSMAAIYNLDSALMKLGEAENLWGTPKYKQDRVEITQLLVDERLKKMDAVLEKWGIEAYNVDIFE